MTIPKLSIVLLCLMLGSFCAATDAAYAADAGPVLISFDQDAARIDLLTKHAVPEYQYAERGSIRFYLWNINEAQDYFTYLHDGIRTAPATSMKSMVKVQEEFAVWILTFKNDGRNSPRVRELAVSFIPLIKEGTGFTSGERVHLRLDELNKIVWEE